LIASANFFAGAALVTRPSPQRDIRSEFPSNVITTPFYMYNLLSGTGSGVYVAEQHYTLAFYNSVATYRLAYVFAQLKEPEKGLDVLEPLLACLESASLERDFETAIYALASGLCLDISEKRPSSEADPFLERVLHYTTLYSFSALSSYNAACAFSLRGEFSLAISSLERAIEQRHCLPSKDHALADTQLTSLREWIRRRYPDDNIAAEEAAGPVSALSEPMYGNAKILDPKNAKPMRMVGV
jgi:tetratricopeptide (TPR) repeat protein